VTQATVLVMEYTLGCCMAYLIARLNSSGVSQDGNVSIKLPGSLGLSSLVHQHHALAHLVTLHLLQSQSSSLPSHHLSASQAQPDSDA